MPYKQVGVKERRVLPPSQCDGAGETGKIPDKYKNITPVYRVMCFGCGDEFKPIDKGSVPNHPPKGLRFFFKAKFADSCVVSHHTINKGDMVRYLGTKIVCKLHA